MSVEAANVALNHDSVFRLIGALNARTGVIESVFLVYPANEEYGLSYAYRRRLERNRWIPWPTGILWQNGRLTLMVAVSSHDEHYWDLSHHESVVQLAELMEELRRKIGARQKTFAGILPGVLASRGILDEPPEGAITATVVAQAVRTLASEHPEPPAVIVLGGRGYIGRRLVAILEQEMDVHPVDVQDPEATWPGHLEGAPALLVNVANRHALPAHVDKLWPGMTILNEVYPEPDEATLDVLTDLRIAVHHVVGVKAWAFPPFPAAYSGAIPCCAAWPSDQAEVVTRHLNPFASPKGG